MKPVTIPAMLSKFRTRVDRTLSFQVDTQELPAETKSELFGFEQQLGWVTFSPTQQEEVHVPTEKIEWEGQKTPSQRLYGALFVLHQKQGGKAEEFEEFRRRYMDQVINNVKARIAELDEGRF